MVESHKDVPPSTLIHVGSHSRIYIWGCFLMTFGNNSMCLNWNTLYMYKIDLLWVWSVCGLSIIQPTVTAPRDPLSTHRSQRQISGCGGILMTYSRCSRCWIALYMYEEDLLWEWREWGVSIIRTNRSPPPIPTTSTLRADIRLWQYPYDL
jgi:hypothetical protein